MPTPTKITKFGGSRAVIIPHAWFDWLEEHGYPEPEKLGMEIQDTAIVLTYVAPATTAQTGGKT